MVVTLASVYDPIACVTVMREPYLFRVEGKKDATKQRVILPRCKHLLEIRGKATCGVLFTVDERTKLEVLFQRNYSSLSGSSFGNECRRSAGRVYHVAANVLK